MPELPEVETIKRDLQKTILHKEIVSYEVLLPRAFINLLDIDIIGEIESIDRIGKYLIINIKEKATIIIHLRMTGKLIYLIPNSELRTPNSELQTPNSEKHLRVIFNFSDSTSLYFHDIRSFGRIEVFPYHTTLTQVKNIGIDALSPTLTQKTFQTIISVKKKPLQSLLLDQTIIAGIGNIYMQEILFDAKISPVRNGESLSTREIKRLHQSTIKILRLACLHNGTSISDFRRVDDQTGEFQHFLQVYGKKICPVCKNTLKKVKNGGRTTTYCEKCQK